jgi:transcription elongation GreA/GreB family factor
MKAGAFSHFARKQGRTFRGAVNPRIVVAGRPSVQDHDANAAIGVFGWLGCRSGNACVGQFQTRHTSERPWKHEQGNGTLERCIGGAYQSIIASLVRSLGVTGELALSVAFTKEESAATASETLLPDRPISSNPNLVTETGLKALELALEEARAAYEAAQKTEDINERRRLSAIPLRDARYFSERLRMAQVVPNPTSTEVVAFGSTVTFSRADGRVQKFRIVGEDEADPKAGSVSFVSPVARSLLGRSVGDVVGSGGQELEIVTIS